MENLNFKDDNEFYNKKLPAIDRKNVSKIVHPLFSKDNTSKVLKINTNLDHQYMKLDMQEKALDMEVEYEMNDEKILEKYMDKIDQDRREQEQRLSQSIQSMEQRIVEERRLSEERMEKRYLDVMKAVEKTNDNIDNKIEDIRKDNKETKKWIIGLCLTTILGIDAMVVAVVLAVWW